MPITCCRILLLILVFMAAGTEIGLARAGGGGAEGGGGSLLMIILAFILAPFFFIYSLIMTFLWKRKGYKAEKLANKLSDADRMWHLRDIKARVETAFFKVQKAWMERNQDLASDCMTDRIYEKHKMQTDAFIESGTKNMLENINLLSIMITSVEDYQDNNRDSFSALIKGRMTDYHIKEKTKTVFRGDPNKTERFEEIWKFIRVNNAWLLDEIDQEANRDDLNYSRAYTQQ
jgi:preprotein translocase subunit SecG